MSSHFSPCHPIVCTHLNRTGLIFVVFSIGLEVVNVDGGQAGDEQLQLLLSEDGDQSLGDDLIKALQEGGQLFTDCTWETEMFQLPDRPRSSLLFWSSDVYWSVHSPVIFIWQTRCTYSFLFSSVTMMLAPLAFRSLTSHTPNSWTCEYNMRKRLSHISLYENFTRKQKVINIFVEFRARWCSKKRLPWYNVSYHSVLIIIEYFLTINL